VSAADVLAEAGVVLDRVREAAHLEHRFLERLALLPREQRREVLLALVDQALELVEDLGALRERRVGPAGQRARRGLDRLVRVARGPLRDAVDDLAGRGVLDVLGGAAARRDAVAADDHLCRHQARPRHHDALLLDVVVERLGAVLAAEAARLDAAERHLVVAVVQRVDPDVAGLQLLGRAIAP
jgi:hypothetical protein